MPPISLTIQAQRHHKTKSLCVSLIINGLPNICGGNTVSD